MSKPSVAVVIPAYNAAHHLDRVLPAALQAAGDSPVVVVDPGSTDGTAERAQELGARVVRMGYRAGPAEARNVGAAAVDCDVLLFIDSDCVAHPDVVKRVREAFAGEPALVSLTGSYDSSPPAPGFFSQYMNLRHHYTHQMAAREPAGFWAGCGAVRADAFRAAGRFDAERYPRPQIEDIELGVRIAEFGKTRLDRDLHVTHLKRWTLRSVIETDIFSRAVPWSRLILEQGEMPNDLNLRTTQRVAAALAPLVLACAVALPVLALLGWWTAAALAMLPLAVSVGLHLPMIRYLARLRGLLFALGAWLFHQVHLSYSAATFAICSLVHRL